MKTKREQGMEQEMDMEANAFALALLMPIPLLNKELKALKGEPMKLQVKRLAKIFQVDEWHVATRLISLGIIL